MSKIKRLERLLLSINSKKHFTLKELADEFGVSTRTIQRDLLNLIEMGLPIVSEFGPHGGYRIENDRILPPIGFTEMEASSILFSLQTYTETSFPFQTQSKSIVNKLHQFMPEDAKDNWTQIQKRLFVQLPLPPKNSIAPIILEAAIKQKIVTILYTMKEQKLYSNIQLIGLFSENGEWYCPAYCYSLMDYHTFKLSDIKHAVINYEPIEVKDFTEVTIHNWASQITPRNYVRLEAEISEEGLNYCESHPFLRQFIRTKENGLHGLSGTVLATYVEKAAEYLWPLKTSISIQSPIEIKEFHARWAREISTHYEVILNM
ncbi:helix-turn-helix transcriptional regulator [Fictibacillus phosphorivorans]|uniref:helix-turn-helix transcriptional regulator n=1 Tax=Fictibacillus phosphorivorans TaxID=1221500 RepID=UPI001294082A|nr:WYL domain-containing protein [Fictibacillus phosphorivorans]MQR96909.1 WYL domain-containing protein [Fictibacillus phosphorivorans]